MEDLLMIFGTDTSSYQPYGSYDPAGFEIINALDRTLPAKIAHNRAEARPSGIYSWVFPGERGAATVGRALAALDSVGGGLELGFWWDYEQDDEWGTVEQWQLDECFAACDEAGFWSGYYANMWRPDHRDLLGRPFWCAGYPWPNDGTFPGFERAPAGRTIDIWQFTSTNGTLDQDVVVDEAWFASLTGSGPAPAPVPPPAPKEHDVIRRLTADIPDVADAGSFWEYTAARWDAVPALSPGVVAQDIDPEAFMTIRGEQDQFRALLAGHAPDVGAVVAAARTAITKGTKANQLLNKDAVEAAIRGVLTP